MSYSWVNFNKELMQKIKEYDTKREELGIIINECLSSMSKPLPYQYDQMDPFTPIMAASLYSPKKNRGVVLSAYKEKFGMKTELPADYDGWSLVNQQKVFVPNPKNKNVDDPVGLTWDFFKTAMDYPNGSVPDSRFTELFDSTKDTYAVGFKKLSIMLFMMNPDYYMTMDEKTCSYLKDVHNFTIDKEGNYLEQLKKLKNNLKKWGYSSLVELSDKSYQHSEQNKSKTMEKTKKSNYWIMALGKKNGYFDRCLSSNTICMGWSKIGDLSTKTTDLLASLLKEHYPDGDPDYNAKTLYDFGQSLKINDYVIIKNGISKVSGLAKVTSDYYFSEKEGDYCNSRNVEWLWNDKDGIEIEKTGKKYPRKALTKVSKRDIEFRLKQLIDAIGHNPFEKKDVHNNDDNYSEEELLEEVFISKEKYDIIKETLLNKKNVILQGPPGVGKTFMATKICDAIVGKKDYGKIKIIQFHQNYSYEDFLIGLKPNDKAGFSVKPGVFKEFCEIAAGDKDNKYFFIIDEINRGNISKIFGEVMNVIEYRGKPITLMYDDGTGDFTIPENVYIIGMMNTADRSIAIIDYALRRRFVFIDIEPNFKREKIDRPYYPILDIIEGLNTDIKGDSELGPGYMIGHSYFLQKNMTPELVVKTQLIPLIREYWMNDSKKADEWSNKLSECLKQN